ncbi:response regulator [Spiribacter halobius]|nr:response regulator [Spiribacter halobius]UEX79307.1 response regulator [Spiribacter halobius]
MTSADGGEDIRRDLAALVTAWEAMRDGADAAHFEAMRRHCAGVAAAAEASGHRRLAELAGVAEIMLTPLARAEEPADPLLLRTLDDYVEALRRLDPGAPPESPAMPCRRARLITGDDTAVARLRPLLRDLAWGLEVLPDATGAADPGPAELIVLDLDGSAEPDRLLSGLTTALGPASAGPQPPVVALAARGSAALRLTAARAGAAGFWLKGMSRDLLAAELDRLALAAAESARPLRVLLRDDSRTQTAYYRNVLQRAGLTVEAADSADAVFEALLQRPPDLLLLDLHMPDCDGAELTRAVRQLPGLGHLPVVFLSMETDVRRQLDALAAGGDDFLVKPVSGGQLLRTVTLRATRGRTLRQQSGRDGATGALVGEALRARIRHEQWRAERDRRPLQLALLRRCEAAAGPAGTELTALALRLNERLRRTDVLGRHSSDALVVLLPGAGEQEARALLSPLLQAEADHAGWRLGLAGQTPALDAEGLLLAAEAALA